MTATAPGHAAVADVLVARRGRLSGDRVFEGALRLVATSFVVLVLALIVTLVIASIPAIRSFGWRFLVGTNWDPVAESFGALPFVYGTLLSSLLAMLLAVPLGIGAAIYLAELAPFWVRPPIGFLIELLAAVPSVVYGLWASSCSRRSCAAGSSRSSAARWVSCRCSRGRRTVWAC